MLRNKLLLTLCLIFAGIGAYAQTGSLTGRVLNTEGEPMEWTSVQIPKLGIGVSTDKKGEYVVPNIPLGTWEVEVMYLGYNTQKTKLTIGSAKVIKNFTLESSSENLEEVVITGTLKEVRKSESPVPVTIISSKMFQRNVTSNVSDALYQVNGINPQINCNMCNTSDIGINGMQGPYTMILIDGMPIVSSLSSVYGMSGIPNSIIN
jgi:outer membrane receptor for ferrienterochelin and colicins